MILQKQAVVIMAEAVTRSKKDMYPPTEDRMIDLVDRVTWERTGMSNADFKETLDESLNLAMDTMVPDDAQQQIYGQ